MLERVLIQIDLDILRLHMERNGVKVSEEEVVASLENFGFEQRPFGLWECDESCLATLDPSEFRRIGCGE